MTSWHTLVSAETAAAQLDDPRLRVFDCRYDLMHPGAGRAAWAAGHLPGAVHVDLHDDLAATATPRSGRHPLPDPSAFAGKLRAWGVDDDSLLLAYDEAGGVWAARFWWMASQWLGHRHAAVLDGGLRRWTALGLPTSTAPPSPPRPPGSFRGTPNPAAWVDAEVAQSAAADASQRLLDARAPERFRGEVEPLDPVAGHVPGARNLPTSLNVASDGTLRPVAELRDAFAARLGDVPPQRTVVMCGSGVTACHLLLAMEHAGLHGARLYAGSWSEWSRDPSRPVARGEDRG
jgi:thiosulfate/3-mercaptopyruvate sulfurtransferase